MTNETGKISDAAAKMLPNVNGGGDGMMLM